LGNLSTPKSVQNLQTALHAKAKAEAGYRFYALYDKISRADILAHAYAQCRSNKGAPGVDGQDFADIDAYGVQRWLGELALALRNETYGPDPIRRVFIPKANGKLRPLGISTLRDRVCMTAAMLVLEPIFEADLPPEQYAYRPGRNAQQAVVKVEELLFRVPCAEAREQPYARGEVELPLSKVELDLDWSVHSSVDDGAGRAAPGSVSDVFFDCCSS
jgi:RNA-directed DNA polymerase